jgi:hypothetical protein
MANSKAILEPEELRSVLLEMSGRQREFREILRNYKRETNKPAGTIAREAGTQWKAVKGVLEGTSAVKSGNVLDGLSKLLGCQDLGRQIADNAEYVTDRYLGLTLRSNEVIEAFIKLIAAQRAIPEGYTSEDFASTFGEYSEIVFDALNGNRKAHKALENQKVRNHVLNQLDRTDYPEALQKARDNRLASQKARAEEFSSLVAQLLPFFGEKTKVAEALGCPAQSLYSAEGGHASVMQIEKLNKLARAELEKRAPIGRISQDGAKPSSPPAAQEPVAPSPLSPVRVALGEAVFENFAGATTPDGVKYVLTAESIQSVDAQLLVEVRDFIRRAVETARAALILGAQFKDDQAREILVHDTGPQLRELMTAVKIFTYAHPNQLLELFEDQRNVLSALNSRTTTTRTTSRKR